VKGIFFLPLLVAVVVDGSEAMEERI